LNYSPRTNYLWYKSREQKLILIKIFKIKFIVLITLTVLLAAALLAGCSTIKSLIDENIGKSLGYR